MPAQCRRPPRDSQRDQPRTEPGGQRVIFNGAGGDILSKMAMKFWCVLLAAAPALLAQVIEGTVSSSLGGAPIDGASVSIELGGKATYQATTDALGAFRIEGVKDG